MYFLIPPSEGKTPPAEGPTFKRTTLPFPELNPTRDTIIDALVKLATAKPALAAEILDLGPTQSDLLALDANLRTSHCAPAIEVYSGVLFDHFGYASLTSRAQGIANDSILISSALFGFVSPQSFIPAYRLSGSTKLPTLGPLPSLWRPVLTPVLASLAGELVLDMRSGSYAKLAPLPYASTNLEVKVMTLVNGVRKSVTHFNKATKGDLLRAAMTSSKRLPKQVSEVEKYFRSLGFNAFLERTRRGQSELVIITQ